MSTNDHPNILFLLIDCLRADHCFGEKRTVKIPTIDLLTQKGTVFTQAISTMSTTSPVVATIITGMYPFVHGIRSLRGYKLNPKCTTLPEQLRKNGYRTYAMVTGPLHNVLGLDKGFDTYLYRNRRHNLYSDFAEELSRFLKENALKSHPWFLFVHLFELHTPRELLKEYQSRKYGKNLYEQTLSCIDHALKKILDEVNLDNTMVILHGDHGESIPNFLVEKVLNYRRVKKLWRKWVKWRGSISHQIIRHIINHGFHVYDYLVRVPLIFTGYKIPQGKIISDQVGQIDILPTIIDLVGLPQGNIFHGRSLCPLINGEQMEERPLYLEVFPFITAREGNWLVGIRTPQWKFVFAPKNRKRRPELYNLKDDPKELHNLIDKREDVAQMLKEEILKIPSVNLEEVELPGIKMSETEDEEMGKRLKGLGYL